MIRTPLAKILPSFVPVILERGVPGYEAAEMIAGEKRLSRPQIRSLLATSTYFGALDYAGGQLDFDRVEEILKHSMQELADLTPEEKQSASQLIKQFYGHRIIRENHSFDDWLSEAWWPLFQNIPYDYPSAMSDAVAYGLIIRQSLGECSLEF